MRLYLLFVFILVISSLIVLSKGYQLEYELQKILAYDGKSQDSFGSSISMHGDLVLIGAFRDDVDLNVDQGSAHLLNCVNLPCVPLTVLLPPDGKELDFFGEAVAIYNKIAVVGAPSHDSNGQDKQGAAYVYDCNNIPCNLITKLIANDGKSSDEFGKSVSIYEDLVAIGAPFSGVSTGAVYLYSCTRIGCSFLHKVPGRVSLDGRFGNSVSVYERNLLVGASLEDGIAFNTGAAYYFNCSALTSCIQVSKLLSSDIAKNDNLGSSVSLFKNLAVVGAESYNRGIFGEGAVYVFDCSNGTCQQASKILHQSPQAGFYLGRAVSVYEHLVAVKHMVFDCSSFPCQLSRMLNSTDNYGYQTFATGFEVSFRIVIHKKYVIETNTASVLNGLQNIGAAYVFPSEYVCETEISQEAKWPEVFIGKTSVGECAKDYYVFNGSFPLTNERPSRNCLFNGTSGYWDTPEIICEPSCKINPCQNGGSCFEDRICVCTTSTGRFCEILNPPTCNDIQCLNGGECIPSEDQLTLPATCDCTGTGYEGSRCQINIDDCLSQPCLNGGTCFDVGGNQFLCDCVPGYAGVRCQTDVNDCTADSCQNNGKCIDSGPNSFTCNCAGTGYTGTLCQTPQENDCRSEEFSCLNAGACVINASDITYCDCTNTGYEGTRCQTDINDCISQPCLNDGICSDNGKNSFMCDCSQTLFSGVLCQIETLTCNPNPCQNGGKCTDTGVNAFDCDCSGTAYLGNTCQIYAGDCVANGCQNGGACDGASRSCFCQTNFEGALCEQEKITCDKSVCKNGANCEDGGTNIVKCTCPSPRYVGSTCDIDVLVLIINIVALVVVIAIYFFLKYKYPEANNSVILSLSLSLYDFTTDCLFIFSQRNSENISIYYAAISFIVLPVVFNMGILTYVFLTSVLKHAEMETWLGKNYLAAAAITLFSSTNTEVFTLIKSNLFYMERFNAPLKDEMVQFVMICGLIGNILEDIPQIIIQLYSASNSINTILLLSIIASFLTIGFGLLKRAFLLLLFQVGNKKDRKDRKGENVFHTDSSLGLTAI